jgi:hypothetical protein
MHHTLVVISVLSRLCIHDLATYGRVSNPPRNGCAHHGLAGPMRHHLIHRNQPRHFQNISHICGFCESLFSQQPVEAGEACQPGSSSGWVGKCTDPPDVPGTAPTISLQQQLLQQRLRQKQCKGSARVHHPCPPGLLLCRTMQTRQQQPQVMPQAVLPTWL